MKNIILELAIEALNDIFVPEGSISSYVLYGSILWFLSKEPKPSTQQQWRDAIYAVRSEMAITNDDIRIWKALSSRVPRNAHLVIEVCDLVRVCCEIDKRHFGLYRVIRVDRTNLFISHNHRESSWWSTKYFQSTHNTSFFLESTLWLLFIRLCPNWDPIHIANFLVCIAKRSQESASLKN